MWKGKAETDCKGIGRDEGKWFYLAQNAGPWRTVWLIDLHWVRALTVPMLLCLIDGPFVPHDLISVQESPVPLPKFQMAPRLNVLMSSWSKKGTQIYCIFLSTVPASESPPSEDEVGQSRNSICWLCKQLSHFVILNYYYYRHSALEPVWAETRAQSGDWYSSGTLHHWQVLRGRLPLLSPAV